MPSPPAASVVIPSFDSASFAEAALASVLGQTFRNFEAVLIDDGSEPSNAELLASPRWTTRGIHRYLRSLSTRSPVPPR